MASRVPRVLLAALWSLVACACGRAAGEAPLPASAELARDAEQGLRALGQGRFEVIEMKPGAGSRFDLVDDYLYHTHLYALDFEARLRCTAALSIPQRSELDARVGTPGWSIDDSDRGLALIAVLGPGPRREGETVTVRAAAIFDELEPGRFRFRVIDRRRPEPR